MQKLKMFFWRCSGAELELLKKCPTEASKYVGTGATIFFTGLFAALSAAYALYTIFDSVWLAIGFGLVWGLMIFNLDRFIVSSMRKEGRFFKEFSLAIPRILLAILISIVIAKPLELKIFDKELQPELIVMEQEAYARQEQQLKMRFNPSLDSLKTQVQLLKTEIILKAQKRDQLLQIAQEEADGTGGSRRKNLGPIYKIKKADAEVGEKELAQLTMVNERRISLLEKKFDQTDAAMATELNNLEQHKINGLAARIEALSRVTKESDAVAWAHWFILLLFIAIETAPVFIKLISSKGPYDNLLKTAEHIFVAQEIEDLARINAQTKERTSALPEHEQSFATTRLDAELR